MANHSVKIFFKFYLRILCVLRKECTIFVLHKRTITTKNRYTMNSNFINARQQGAALIKPTNKMPENERMAYVLMYLSGMMQCNLAARTMREFMRGRDKQLLGQEMKNRTSKLKLWEHKVKSGGIADRALWEESDARLEMRVELIARFAILICSFDDSDPMIDFFDDALTRLRFEATNEQTKRDAC